MKKLLALPLAVAAIPAHAAEPPEAEYELVTTAIHVRTSETALPVTVLTGEELRKEVRATLGDTLANQPGLNNASFGPAVGQIVIRGQQGRRVMHLTNAIPNADASGNSADHALSVEPILADTLEVLRGPSTLLYGGGAIGGVVNVIDNRVPQSLPESPAVRLEARHDTAADQDNLLGRLDFATGNFAWHVDALRREWNDVEIPGFAIDPRYLVEEEEEHEEGEEEHPEDEVGNAFGFVENSGGETEAFTLGGSWVFDNGFLGLSASTLDNVYGLPRGAHDHGHEEEEGGEDQEEAAERVSVDMERTRYDLAGEWRDINALVESLRYKLSYAGYEHVEREGLVPSTRFTNDSWQQRLQITHPAFSGWHGVLGWQSSREDFGAEGEESFIPVTDIRSDGIFLVEDYHLDTLTLEVGARFNRDELNPRSALAGSRSFSTHSLSASGLWDFSTPASLGLSWSRAERAPSVEELYSNFAMQDPEDCVIHFATGACEVGNADFETEKSNNTDLSLYLDYGSFDATLTAFHNTFDDYIFQGSSGLEVDGFPIRQYMQTEASFSGLEVDMRYRFLDERLELRLFGDTIEGSLESNGDAPRMPPRRLGSRLTFSGIQWSAFISVLHADDQDEPGRNELPTEGYTRWDLGVDYLVDLGNSGELTLFAKGRNLTDEEIRLSTSYLRGFAPEAGRSVELGLRYRF